MSVIQYKGANNFPIVESFFGEVRPGERVRIRTGQTRDHCAEGVVTDMHADVPGNRPHKGVELRNGNGNGSLIVPYILLSSYEFAEGGKRLIPRPYR